MLSCWFRVLEGLYIGVSCHSLPQCHFVLFWFVIFVVQSFLCHLAPGALATRAKVSVAPQIFSKSWAKRRLWRGCTSAAAPRFQQLRGSGCAVRNGLTWRLPDLISNLAEDAVMFPEVDLIWCSSCFRVCCATRVLSTTTVSKQWSSHHAQQSANAANIQWANAVTTAFIEPMLSQHVTTAIIETRLLQQCIEPGNNDFEPMLETTVGS